METVSTSEEQGRGPERDAEFVKVSAYTTSGAYPVEGYERVKVTEPIGEILSKAGSTLKLTDTTNWIAQVDGREIDSSKSYEANDLKGTIAIHWGPRERGGGC